MMDNYEQHLDRAPVIREVFPQADGVVTAHDTRALGIAVMSLGGGRAVERDVIDPAVGLDAVAGPGTAVARGGRPLAVVHARDDAGADAAEAAVRAAIMVGETAPPGDSRRRGGPAMSAAVAAVPKAELHVHLEGTATPDLVRRLAHRNAISLPDGLFGPTERSRGRASWTSCAPTTTPPAPSALRRTTATSPMSTSPPAPRRARSTSS